MSSSPLDPANVAAANDREGPYRKSVLQVDDLIEHGNSLSGHERDVCFLNLGGKEVRFATASAASGFDSDGDGRALAPVDWDGDGDLDVWMSSRTAPMLTFLRNDCAVRGDDWLEIKPEATAGARDGIGARVTVELASGAIITRVSKAGEGFLTQTSRWLHFGLGRKAKIVSVQVRWPGRKEETFSGAAPGRRWILREGTGKALEAAWKVSTPATGAARNNEMSGTVHARCGSRVPVPLLPWLALDGDERAAGGKQDHLILINLWATWCPDCSTEWKNFSAHATDFEKAGIRVLALCVDGIVPGGSPGDPAAHLKKLGAPFPAGRATAATMARVEQLRAHCWGVKWPLPVPSSVLLDREGRLLSMWAGPAPAGEVIADAARAELGNEAFHDSALPFPGKWLERPEPLPPLGLALPLMENDGFAAAREYAERAAPVLSGHREFGLFMTWIGDRLMAANQPADAVKAYETALAAAPDDLTALNNIAWQRAAHPDEKIRDGAAAVKYAERAAELSKHAEPSILDTLAAAYAQAGRFDDAVATAEKALALARAAGNSALTEGIRKSQRLYRLRKAWGR
ncbi:MAG TPA: ASPIC/UnbV domain-containing protein [Verrucomicrobiales bacterium]|nr:ASPIC/UnbV domain-containing protein [Verrucomicrobiales bacterium]